jgi:hypothetical protein
VADETWIKLYRKLTDSLVFSNEKCLKIWIWCLCKSGYIDKEIVFGRQKIKLKKGQFIMGGIKAEETLRIARTTIYYWLNFLKDEGMIDIKKTNKYTIITIQNWDEYQNVDIKKTSNVTSDGQQMDTNKNIKNIKKEYNIYSEQSSEMILSKLLYELMLKNNPNAKQPNFQVWAKNIDKMIRLDNRTVEQIEGAIRWSQQDSFWSGNILSTDKLKKQYDKLFLAAKRGNGNGKSKPVITENELRSFSESVLNDDRFK